MKKTLLSLTILLLSSTLFAQNTGRSGERSSIEICLVTVDANSTHNIIYWDKTSVTNASYFKIYRENTFGLFVPIDSVSADSLSEYHDMIFDPNVTKARYKISVVDTLGLEGPLSLFHGTIFCDEPSSGFFDWNDYEIEGSPSPTLQYVMLRNDSIGGTWHSVDTVSGSVTDYIDALAASFPDGEWRVRTIWPITCTPTKASVSTSRSNVRNRGMLSGVNQAEKENTQVVVYPNPTTDGISIRLISGSATRISLKSLNGSVLNSFVPTVNNLYLSMNEYSSGMYILEIETPNSKIIKKIIHE